MPAKIIVVTGIANPQPLLDHLRTNYEILEALTFPDHKDFNATDVAEIMKKRRKFAGETIGILTTEKDYVKLVNLVNPTDNFYYLPIAVKLITKKDEFNQLIFDYINSY